MTNRTELVPVFPPDNHPYMLDLYRRSGLPIEGGSADEVLAVAAHKWEAATDVGGRAEVAELLLGRIVEGGELRDLGAAFNAHMFEGGRFDGLLAVTSQIAAVDATTYPKRPFTD